MRKPSLQYFCKPVWGSFLAEELRDFYLQKSTSDQLPTSWEPGVQGTALDKRPSRMGTRSPALAGRSLKLPNAQHPPPYSLWGDPVVRAVNLRTLNHASFQGFADSPLLPPPSLTAGASLGTSKAASSHHSNCPSHQWMEITFHDGSSDVAFFCVDQNHKTNQTLGV